MDWRLNAREARIWASIGRHEGMPWFTSSMPAATTECGKTPATRSNAWPRLQKAAGVQNFLLRTKDVPAVLDQLERWNKTTGHELAGRLDLSRVGMSGHSFGAVTTQGVSGQSFPIGGRFTDKRIKAALAMSPNAPRQGDVKKAFGSVGIPWMLMTGTRDTSPVGKIDVESRLAVFPALPPGGKYELVLDRAEHSAFDDRPLPGDKEARNPNHHRLCLAALNRLLGCVPEGRSGSEDLARRQQPRQIARRTRPLGKEVRAWAVAVDGTTDTTGERPRIFAGPRGSAFIRGHDFRPCRTI